MFRRDVWQPLNDISGYDGFFNNVNHSNLRSFNKSYILKLKVNILFDSYLQYLIMTFFVVFQLVLDIQLILKKTLQKFR